LRWGYYWLEIFAAEKKGRDIKYPGLYNPALRLYLLNVTIRTLGRPSPAINSLLVAFLAARVKCIFGCLQFWIAEILVVAACTAKLLAALHGPNVCVS